MVQYFQNLDELVSLVYQFESQETCGFQVQPSNKISLDKIALIQKQSFTYLLFHTKRKKDDKIVTFLCS